MRSSRYVTTLAAAMICALLALAQPPALGAFNFTRIADTSTPIPGGSGTFTSFDPQSVVVGAELVTFRGFGSAGQEGIYSGNAGSLQKRVDRNSIVPGTAGTFQSFGSPTNEISLVYFQASGAGRTGVYRFAGANVQVVHDDVQGSAVYGRPAASSSHVAFLRNGVVWSNRGGGGTFSPVSISPGLTITAFGDPDVGELSSAGNAPIAVRVHYTDGVQARSGVLYSASPGGDQILHPADAGATGEVSASYIGTYAVIQSGTVIHYALWGPEFPQQIQAGFGGFIGFREVAAGSPNLGERGTEITFLGIRSDGREAIHAIGYGLGEPPVNSLTLINTGDVLDGRIVNSLNIGRDAHGGAISFHASFTDGSSGIYYVFFAPEPTFFAMVVPGLSLMMRRGRRS